MNVEEQKLYDFLKDIQLEQFYEKLTSELHVTRISHFDYADEDDLSSIGMSRPDLRRLFENLKKLRKKSSNFFSKFRRSIRREPSVETKVVSDAGVPSLYSDPIFLSKLTSPTGTLTRSTVDARQGLKCLILETEIELDDFLGRGAFGYVRKGIWKTNKKVLEVAVKCLKSNDAASVQLQNEFIKEANSMSNLDHPNLIRLYGIVLATPMMLVTELAPLGSLLGRLRSEPEKFLISTLCSIVVQIASGMKYLQENRCVHRDLAARNILLMSYEKIKIGDFGLMRALPSDMDYYIMQPNGLVPYAWCAPECLQYRKFSHASDIWAFGVTVIEIFSYGKEPWPGLNGAQILEKIQEPNCCRPEQPDHCPNGFYKIIKHFCWHDNPDMRGSFSEIERRLLLSLPTEILANGDFSSEDSELLAFHKGDTITLFEQRDDQMYWKGQNRMTGQVGYVPVNKLPVALIESSPQDGKEAQAKSYDDTHEISLPLDGTFVHCAHRGHGNEPEWGPIMSPDSLRGKENRTIPRRIDTLQRSRRVTGVFLDYDSSSLSSGSSSGSSEQYSSSASYNRLPTPQTTRPVLIRGSTSISMEDSSSGYSSGRPSLENSFPDDVDGLEPRSQRTSADSEVSAFENVNTSYCTSPGSCSSRKSSDTVTSPSTSETLYENVSKNDGSTVNRSSPIVIPSASPSPKTAGSPNSISKVPIIIPAMGGHCFSPQSADDFKDGQRCTCPRHLYEEPTKWCVSEMQETMQSMKSGLIYSTFQRQCSLSAPTTSNEKDTLHRLSRQSGSSVKEFVVLKSKKRNDPGQKSNMISCAGHTKPDYPFSTQAGSAAVSSTSYECMNAKGTARVPDSYERMHSTSNTERSTNSGDVDVSRTGKATAFVSDLYQNVTLEAESITNEAPPPLPAKSSETFSRSLDRSLTFHDGSSSTDSKTRTENRSKKTRSRFFGEEPRSTEPQPPFPPKCSQRRKSLQSAYENVSYTNINFETKCISLPSSNRLTSDTEFIAETVSSMETRHLSTGYSPCKIVEGKVDKVHMDGAKEAACDTSVNCGENSVTCSDITSEFPAQYYENVTLQQTVCQSENIPSFTQYEIPPPLPPKQSRQKSISSVDDESPGPIGPAYAEVRTKCGSKDIKATSLDTDSTIVTAEDNERKCRTEQDLTNNHLSPPLQSFMNTNMPCEREDRIRSSSSPQLSHRGDHQLSTADASSPIPPPRKHRKDAKERRHSLHGSALSNSLKKCVIVDINRSPPGQAPYDLAAGRESLVAKLNSNIPTSTDINAPPVPPREVDLTKNNSHNTSDGFLVPADLLVTRPDGFTTAEGPTEARPPGISTDMPEVGLMSDVKESPCTPEGNPTTSQINFAPQESNFDKQEAGDKDASETGKRTWQGSRLISEENGDKQHEKCLSQNISLTEESSELKTEQETNVASGDPVDAVLIGLCVGSGKADVTNKVEDQPRYIINFETSV